MGVSTNDVMNFSDVDPTHIFGPPRDALEIVVPITVIYCVIFVTGLFGNTFTCTVIIRNKSMHTATNYYLFSLAVSDLLLLVSGMPQEIYSIWYKWPYVFGYSFCVLRGLAAETSTNASVLTITLFTIERYLAICHPFVSHKMSKLPRATKHVILLWVAAFCLALPQALQFGLRDHQGVIMCLQTRVIIKHSFEISTFFFFFAPMVLITVLYALIGLKLRRNSITTDSMKGNERELCRNSSIQKMRRRNSQSTKRVVNMLVAVVVAFFVCWAPFHAQRLVYIYGVGDNHIARSPLLHATYLMLTYMSGVFYYMSTCINPIFYHIMSNKFREAFKNTMMECCCRKKRHQIMQKSSYNALPLKSPHDHSGETSQPGNLRKGTHASTTRMDSFERTRTSSNLGKRNSSSSEGKGRPQRTPTLTSLNLELDDHRLKTNSVSVVSERHLFNQCCCSQDSPCDGTPIPNEVFEENKTEIFPSVPAKYMKEIKSRTQKRDKDCR